jgi:hypothetical protein
MNINKTLKFSGFFLLICITFIISYNRWNKTHHAENPFADLQETPAASRNGYLTLKGTNYDFSNLPKDVQFELVKEDQAHHDKKSAILKDFAIRLHLAQNANSNVSSTNLPKTMSYITNQLSPIYLEEIYQKEKHLFPPNHSPALEKSRIALDFFSNKSYQLLSQNLTYLFSTKSLTFNIRPAAFPSGWLSFDNLPTMGSQSANNRLFIISHYNCLTCSNLSKSLPELFNDIGPTNLHITYIPFAQFASTEGLLNRAGLCINEQNSKSFWLFHIDLIKNYNELQKFSPDIKLNEITNYIAKNIIKFNLDTKAFKACMSDKNIGMINLFANIEAKLKFLDTSSLPIFILNNHKLDTEGRTLSQSLDQWSIK